jgi:hypothetical protein
MGHIRIGELPKTRRWSHVVRLMDDPDVDVGIVARAVVAAAEKAYRAAGEDPGVVESLRVMAFLADASRREDFAEALRGYGFTVTGNEDAVGLLGTVLREAENRFGPTSQRTIFTEFALGALQESLTRTIASQTGSLFLSGLDDARQAYRSFSTERGFAQLAHLFFARLLSRSLRYFTDHEAANRLGGDGRLRSEAELQAFTEGVDRYASEAARIVEDFAGGWYSKRQWLGGLDRTEGVAAVAMRKIADELTRAS